MVLKTTSKSPSFRCTMGYQIPYLKPVFRSHLVLVNLFTPTLRICNIRLKIRSIQNSPAVNSKLSKEQSFCPN